MIEPRSTLFLLGATGHTGSRVAARLLQDGFSLRCLVHTPARAAHIPRDPRVELVTGDVSQPAAWQDRLAGCAAVIHMAHIGLVAHTAAACAAVGVRRLVATSSTRRFTRFPEETAARVIAGEAALESTDLDYTIIRPSMIFGGDRDNNLERVARWLRRTRFMPLLAGGSNLVQPIFVLDLVEAIVRALQSPAAIRRALTVAGPQPLTQRAMLETLGHALGRPPIWIPVPYAALHAAAALLAFLPKPPLTPPQVRRMLEDKTFDIREAQQALNNWTPRPFEEAIALKVKGQA